MPLHSKPSVEEYQQDPLFPRIECATLAELAQGSVVAPINVLVRMELLRAADIDAWRRGQVPYLERVIQGSLPRLSRLLRILRMYAHDLRLVPSSTAYVRWGNGTRVRLRFTKTGDPNVEDAYARHFVWPGKRPFRVPGTPSIQGRADETHSSIQ